MDNLGSIFKDWIMVVVGYTSGILYIGFIDARLAGISIIFTIFIGGVIHYLNLGALRWRRFRRDYEDKMTRQLVIMIMEKFTILKSNKLLSEVRKLGDLSDKR
jgi:LytS/YehU family sensor histidine kinase